MAYYKKYKKQQLMVDGIPVQPAEYQKGELIGVFKYDSQTQCEQAD